MSDSPIKSGTGPVVSTCSYYVGFAGLMLPESFSGKRRATADHADCADVCQISASDLCDLPQIQAASKVVTAAAVA